MDKILIILILLSLAAISLVVKLVRDTTNNGGEEKKSTGSDAEENLGGKVEIKSENKTKKLYRKDMKEDILAYSKELIKESYAKLNKKNMDLDIKINDKLFVEFEKAVWKEGLEHIVNIFNEKSKQRSTLSFIWENDLKQLKIKNDKVALEEKDLRDILYPFESANERADRGIVYDNMDDYSWKLFVKVLDTSTEIIFKKI